MIINLKDCFIAWIGGFDSERANKMNQLLTTLGFENNLIRSPITTNKHLGNRKNFQIALTKALTIGKPILILEDDVNITQYYTSLIDVPDDADAVWLGTSIYGLIDDWAIHKFEDSIFLKQPTCLGEYKNFYKIENMLSCHATLFITSHYKQEICNYINYCVNEKTPIDIILAATMKHFNIYASKQPMFYQDDNAHNYQPTITPLANIF